jgi:hypothetical protein
MYDILPGLFAISVILIFAAVASIRTLTTVIIAALFLGYGCLVVSYLVSDEECTYKYYTTTWPKLETVKTCR